MALLDTTRIRLHPTPAERLALTLATWISLGVAHRMDRRAARAVEVRVTQDAAAAASARRDGERARAYLLGIR